MDTVALAVNFETATRALNGECLPREALLELAGDLPAGHVRLILERDSLEDGQALANAIVVALGIVPASRVQEVDALIPDGWQHIRFLEPEPGRMRQMRLVGEILQPVRFCE